MGLNNKLGAPVTLDRESVQPIDSPSDKRIAASLKLIRSYGKSSYASLTAPDGSWVQVAGGRVTCALERRSSDGRIYRASQDTPVVPPSFDGAELCFGGGSIHLRLHEWFNIGQVTEVFLAFANGRPMPYYVHWREVTEELRPHLERT